MGRSADQNADEYLAELEEGGRLPCGHALARVIGEKFRAPSELQQELFAALDSEHPIDRGAWAERIWKRIDELPLAKQGGLRMLVLLLHDDAAIDGYTAEHVVAWGKEQGLTDAEIIEGFDAALTAS